jgi:hypothetical protein
MRHVKEGSDAEERDLVHLHRMSKRSDANTERPRENQRKMAAAYATLITILTTEANARRSARAAEPRTNKRAATAAKSEAVVSSFLGDVTRTG